MRRGGFPRAFWLGAATANAVLALANAWNGDWRRAVVGAAAAGLAVIVVNWEPKR